MQLKDTVAFFSTETFTDVFSSVITFKGKINPFSEVANSGASSQRRILETTPLVTIPQARVIVSPTGEKFIVAAANQDYWNGSAIRNKYPILPVSTMGEVGSIGEILAGAPSDSEVYTYPYFVRREIDEESRSDYLSGYEVYFSQVKSFERSSILTLGAKTFRMRTDTWIDGAGFAVSQALLLEDAFQTFDIKTERGEYNAVTDSYPETPVNSVDCFVEYLQEGYEFVTPSFTKIEVGDKAISVLKADATMGINDLIGDYRVQSIREFSTWVTCQCRKLS